MLKNDRLKSPEPKKQPLKKKRKRQENRIAETTRTRTGQRHSRIKTLEHILSENEKELFFLKGMLQAYNQNKQACEQLSADNQQLRMDCEAQKARRTELDRLLATLEREVEEVTASNKQERQRVERYRRRIDGELDGLRAQVAEMRRRRQERGDDRELADLVRLRIEALFLSADQLCYIVRKAKKYSSSELAALLKQEPFLLSDGQVLKALRHIEPGPGAQLLQKLLAWIGEIEAVSQEEEENVVRIISIRFTKLMPVLRRRLPGETVAKDLLVRVLKEEGLDDRLVRVVVRRLSLFSSDLQHLSLSAFWQLFQEEDIFT